VTEVLKGIDALKVLSAERRREIANEIWTGYNKRLHQQGEYTNWDLSVSCLCLETTHPSPNGATFPHKGRLLTLLPSIVAGENCACFKLYVALSVYCRVFRVCEPSLVREGGPLAVDE
jgi:hypothetical protein